jgi:hypothetical protein
MLADANGGVDWYFNGLLETAHRTQPAELDLKTIWL